ncbi:anhydro-N-acetylmuramic acid kinase [Acidiferrobacter sp.]|jgi:anhydro-N-acetylmuramic acid kinase|uniref:anhydro-N-acetylmuramic acid kinase n=1 Tax=Acidiferrobacter sp. TaxID=1872107 RepID=UPI002611435C|nr:anhydro-N-acetylmuramic acid kinase [Acidiferrobacter sp.]
MPSRRKTSAHHYIGLMSGTSGDGVDAVCVHFDEDAPQVALAAHCYQPYPESLRERLLSLMVPGENEIDRMGTLEGELAEIFAAASTEVHRQAGLAAHEITAIGSHGQTIRHRPRGPHAFTLQIGDPARIAERTGITTIADFRRRDMAAGGQGAPLVPAFHQWLFGHATRTRAIVNIGGIANITVIPAADRRAVAQGFDTGPGNALLDGWVRLQTGAPQDTDGRLAARGQADGALLALLKDDPYFMAPPPKSTGREHFTLKWLDDRLQRLGRDLGAANVQATLVALTADTITEALAPLGPEEVYLCGGGTANPVLMAALTSRLAIPIQTTARLGLDPQLVEPTAFAWLAREALAGRPGNLPSVTGARHPVVLGALYPA